MCRMPVVQEADTARQIVLQLQLDLAAALEENEKLTERMCRSPHRKIACLYVWKGRRLATRSSHVHILTSPVRGYIIRRSPSALWLLSLLTLTRPICVYLSVSLASENVNTHPIHRLILYNARITETARLNDENDQIFSDLRVEEQDVYLALDVCTWWEPARWIL